MSQHTGSNGKRNPNVYWYLTRPMCVSVRLGDIHDARKTRLIHLLLTL